MDSWYFAYGSNLSIEQMIARIGSTGSAEHQPRIAHLANHRLVFQQLEPGGPAFANILSPGDGVLGVVYRCRPADLARLDDYEGCYQRQPIQVTDRQGEVLAAVAYVAGPAPPVAFGRPSAEYLARIVSGARQHGLPEQYIGQIVATALSAAEPGNRPRKPGSEPQG